MRHCAFWPKMGLLKAYSGPFWPCDSIVEALWRDSRALLPIKGPWRPHRGPLVHDRGLLWPNRGAFYGLTGTFFYLVGGGGL